MEHLTRRGKKKTTQQTNQQKPQTHTHAHTQIKLKKSAAKPIKSKKKNGIGAT